LLCCQGEAIATKAVFVTCSLSNTRLQRGDGDGRKWGTIGVERAGLCGFKRFSKGWLIQIIGEGGQGKAVRFEL
jgi:hypothetical protein